jgi:hypothetical protein
MKNRFIKLSILAAVIALAVGTVQAQAPVNRKKKKRSKRTTKIIANGSIINIKPAA